MHILSYFEYVSLETDKLTYITITYESLQHCKKFKKTIISTKILHPPKQLTNKIKILTDRKFDLNECNIKIRKLSCQNQKEISILSCKHY